MAGAKLQKGVSGQFSLSVLELSMRQTLARRRKDVTNVGDVSKWW